MGPTSCRGGYLPSMSHNRGFNNSSANLNIQGSCMHQALPYGHSGPSVKGDCRGQVEFIVAAMSWHYGSILQVPLPCQVKVLVPSVCGGPGYNPSPTPSHQGTLRVCEVTEFHGPKACGQGCRPISNPRTQELLRRTRCIGNQKHSNC